MSNYILVEAKGVKVVVHINIITQNIINNMIEVKVESQLKIKIVLVGDSGVGKTNIKNRFCRGSFRQFSNSTVGIQLANRKFWGPYNNKQEQFELVIWDIGTKNYDSTLLPTYFKNAFGVIYVYDITKKQTFQNLQSWKQIVAKNLNSQKYTEIVLGNKTDLLHFRQVYTQQVQKWVIGKRIGLFYEVSALQNLYIQDAITNLIKKIVTDFDQKVKEPLKLRSKQARHRGCI